MNFEAERAFGRKEKELAVDAGGVVAVAVVAGVAERWYCHHRVALEGKSWIGLVAPRDRPGLREENSAGGAVAVVAARTEREKIGRLVVVAAAAAAAAAEEGEGVAVVAAVGAAGVVPRL